MPLIHLSSKQRKCRPLSQEYVWPNPIERSLIPELVEKHLGGDKSARQELINGLMFLVPFVVGRYLYHWAPTRRFEDDMVGEASLALIEAVDKFEDLEQAPWLASFAIAYMCNKIEVYLNDFQEIFAASLRTNHNLAAQGKEPEYAQSVQLDENLLYYEDYSLAEVDLRDSFSALCSCDGEELVTAVLRFLEQKHGIQPEELSSLHYKVIEQLSGFVRELL